MKKAGFFISIPLLLTLVSQVHANESSVHISSDGNASATVKVENSFNSTSSNTTTSHTSVKIESDGEVKEYNSDSLDDVEMESSDGNSKVSIKNSGNTDLTSTPSPEIEKKDVKTTEDVKKEINETQNKEEGIFEKVKEFITNLFKSIF